ncbi:MULTISPECIES: tetratricopeptide repeat protein [Calothrix]|uniref:Tetratricopeptide repeat protein n=2 Tax=Calothrix TaxID=1186 RepID=A0ABR8AK50_9CYAN|nr:MULTISPECIES: tetratricopeptide repeat protein [Calothrix]MBD2200436.1 tetratricopeptide repeat protein [Calothrix parietina FACHB-288]MBD2227306.1 tetratricopeptide repeat protein [Calothrix anomala FACHB-343]
MRQHKQGKSQKSKGICIQYLSLLTFSLPLFTYLIAVPPLGSIASAQAQNVSASVKKGFTLLNQGLVNDAMTTFQQVLKREPSSLQARLGLAIAYRRAGRISEAWNAYQQVLAIDPNNSLALKTIGLLGTYRPEWQVQGITALTTFLKSNPNDIEALGYRAQLYSYQGRFAESLADYRLVLANNPTPEVVIGAAQAYSYSNDFPKALELFNRYQSMGKPIVGYAAVAYGRTLRETGDSRGAVQVLEAQLKRSSSLDALAIETRKELAIAYLANQQQAQALAILDPLQGRADAILPLARSLNEIRKRVNNPTLTQQVISLYNQALSNNPNPSPTLLREVADVFSAFPQGRQTALKIYRQIASQFPGDRGLLVQQLALESQLGMVGKNELKQRLAAILQPLPTNSAQLQQLANALVNINTPDAEFLPVYQTILRSGVNAPFLNFRIAQMYIQQNDLNGARQALAAYTASNTNSQDLAPQLLAAEIERREGSLEASARRYQAILTARPDSNDIIDGALRGLAGVRLQQKNLDEAVAIYDQLINRNPQDLPTQLGRASIAYQAKRISQPEAEAVLNNWLATQPATNTPSELYSLAGVLPADPQREALYNYLLQLDPSYIPLQLRLVQVIAQRNPGQAQARVKQLIARLANNSDSYQLQAELARAVGNLDLASVAYENILAQQPDNIDALAALGGIQFEQRRFESAQEIYNQVLAQKPDDKDTRRALAGLSTVLDQPLSALTQLEKLQMETMAQGSVDTDIDRQMRQIQEDFLLRRGFQPAWEDSQRRSKN